MLGTVEKPGLHWSPKGWSHEDAQLEEKEGRVLTAPWRGVTCCHMEEGLDLSALVLDWQFQMGIAERQSSLLPLTRLSKVCWCILEDFCNEIRGWSGGFHGSSHWLLSLNLSCQVSYSVVLICSLCLHITYNAFGTILNTVQVSTTSLILTTLQFSYYPHFIDLDTEAQRC